MSDATDSATQVVDAIESIVSDMHYDPSFLASAFGQGSSIFGGGWIDKDATVRQYMATFWATKAATYPSESQDDQAEWDYQDARLQKLLGDMEAREMQMDAPSKIDAHSKASRAAYANAATLAATVSDTDIQNQASARINELPTDTQAAKKSNVDASLKTAVKDSASNLASTRFFGIPAWAWGLGIGAAALYFYLPKGRR